MIDIEKIFGVARLRPVQPSDVARVLGVDSIIAGAVLSDLAAKKKLRVSHLKVGSSPLYFLPGNEAQLLQFVNFLNEKDRETVELLKEKRVLRASEQSPLVRVSLSNIKDFAVPLEVSVGGWKEVFYKWFLSGDDEVKGIIRQVLDSKVKSSSGEGSVAGVTGNSQKVGVVKERVVEKHQDENKEDKTIQNKVKSSSVGGSNKSSSKNGTQTASITSRLNESVEKKIISDKDIDKKSDRVVGERTSAQMKNILKKKGGPVVAVAKAAESVGAVKEGISSFFTRNKIEVLNVLSGKRKSHSEYLVRIPTPVGGVKFYCVFLGKSKVSDADISKVVVKSQMRKLPGVLLYSGQLTNKAKELSRSLSELIVKRVE